MNYPSIRIEGAILSPDILDRLAPDIIVMDEAHVYDGEGRLAAHGTGTFKYMKALPVGPGGRRIQKADASD